MAHAYPQGHSCPPGQDWDAPVGKWSWRRGFRVGGVLAAPDHGNVAELSIVSLQWTGIPNNQVGMAAEMALSHRAPHKVLSEAELEEVAQRKPPTKPSLRGCLRKTR